MPDVKEIRVKKRAIDLYKKHYSLVLMFSIPVIYYIIFRYAPMYGIIIAFKDYRFMDGVVKSPWVGLYHFRYAFNLLKFWAVFRNTLIISVYQLLFCWPAPILLALLINEVKPGVFKKSVQTILYLPHFLSWVIMAGLIMAILSPGTGPINAVIKSFGGKAIFFLGNKNWFRPTLIITNIWKGVGWGTIIYLAALSGVNPELYEAAIIDGAGKFQRVLHITMPALIPVTTITLIFAIGAMVNDPFDQIFNLYNPAVYSVGDVLSTYVYRVGLEDMRYSFATAVGLFKNIIAFALIVGTNYLARKFSDYSLW